MSENEHRPKNRKSVRRVIYAAIVFYASFFIFIAVLDRHVLTHPSFSPKLNARDFLALTLSIATAIVFYRWLTKRHRGSEAKV